MRARTSRNVPTPTFCWFTTSPIFVHAVGTSYMTSRSFAGKLAIGASRWSASKRGGTTSGSVGTSFPVWNRTTAAAASSSSLLALKRQSTA
jgi:hypothetical protein